MERAESACERGGGAGDHDPGGALPRNFSRTRDQRATNQNRVAVVYTAVNPQITQIVSAEDYATKIREQLGETWLPRLYRERILKLRTRSYHFENAKRSAGVVIQHTLLGVELKIGRRRLLCPDLATARYLSVFARLGCSDVAVPYDITKISQLADELESSWYRMLLLVEQEAKAESTRLRGRLRGLLLARIRQDIVDAGPGTRVPEFRQTTKQRTT